MIALERLRVLRPDWAAMAWTGPWRIIRVGHYFVWERSYEAHELTGRLRRGLATGPSGWN